MEDVSENPDLILLQIEHLEIRLDERKNQLAANWRGWLDTNRGKAGCLHILDQVKRHSIKKILNDNTQVTGHSGETKWMNEVWLPALYQAGVTHLAWVYSHEFFTQLEIDNVVDRSSGIVIRTFFLKDDAHQWLLMN